MGSLWTTRCGLAWSGWMNRLAGGSRTATSTAAALALDLVFPPRCSFCRVDLERPPGDMLACESCESELIERDLVRCRRCGAVGADAAEDTCQGCRRSKFWFDRVITLGPYDGPLRSAVLRTKTAGHDVLAVTFGALLARRRREQLEAVQADRVRRGTDGVSIAAGRLAKALNLPLARALSRRRNTRLQNGLLRPQRFANVRGAFRWTDRYHFRGARVLLLDDILTTGATASEAARTLKRAGAAQVVAVVLARTSGLD
jgi:predicted amidophosphoribosyltransferase